MRQERRGPCAELEAIEDDMVKELIRTYRRGMNYQAFWELVARIHAFSEMRTYFCEKV